MVYPGVNSIQEIGTSWTPFSQYVTANQSSSRVILNWASFGFLTPDLSMQQHSSTEEIVFCKDANL